MNRGLIKTMFGGLLLDIAEECGDDLSLLVVDYHESCTCVGAKLILIDREREVVVSNHEVSLISTGIFSRTILILDGVVIE